MNIVLTEEQKLFQESFRRYLERDYTFQDRQQDLKENPSGFNSKNWKKICELGWPTILFPENHGGLGGKAMDIALLMEQAGRGLMRDPFLSNVILAGGILQHIKDTEFSALKIEGLITGSLRICLAYQDADDCVTRADSVENGYILQGKKTHALNASFADDILVTTQMNDGSTGIFLVDSKTPGVEISPYNVIDSSNAAHVTFNDCVINASKKLDLNFSESSVIEDTLARGAFAVCAEAVGCMEELYKSTIDYCKTRKQFGMPLAAFQALQHRMADMYIAYQKSKSLLYLTAQKLDDESCNEKKTWLSSLKIQINQSSRFIAQNAIQLHGGMGMTDELCISHYFKRLAVIEQSFGNTDAHMEKLYCSSFK